MATRRNNTQHWNRRRFLGVSAGALAAAPTVLRADETELPSCVQEDRHGPWRIRATSNEYSIERSVEARAESGLELSAFEGDDGVARTPDSTIRFTDRGAKVTVRASIPKYLADGDRAYRLEHYRDQPLMRIWTGAYESAPIEAVLSVDGRQITRGPVQWNNMKPTKSVPVRFEWAANPLPSMRSGRNAVVMIRIGNSEQSGADIMRIPIDLSGVTAATRIGEELEQKAIEKSEARECRDDCYLTTACCEHFGRPDTCWELQTLRWYRDHILAFQADGREALGIYYRVAPTIVSALPASGFRRSISLARIYWLTVIPCAILVRCGAYGLARHQYERTFERLRARWLPA